MKLSIIVLLFLFASIVNAQTSIADYLFQDKLNSFDSEIPALTNLSSSNQSLSWLDPSFGVGGKAVLTFGEAREIAYATAIQPDGKIIIAGETHPTGVGSVDMVLARFNPDGTLDSTFNGNGKVRVDISNNNESVRDIIIQPDGKILIGGPLRIINNPNYYFCVVRLNIDGSLDTSFGGDGIVQTQFFGNSGQLTFSSVSSLSLLPDGRILAVGTAGGYIAFARYNSDGSPDNSFDGDGKLIQLVDGGSTTAQMVMQPDGKIVTVGFTISGNFKIAVARFNSNGSFDQSFGVGGVVINILNAQNAVAWACALQPDGKIVVAGQKYDSSYNIAVVRLNTDGSFDNTFGDAGIVTTDFLEQWDRAFSVLILPDGKILAGGEATIASNANFALARYNPDGTHDNTFGIGGKLTTDFYLGSDQIIELARQDDGKIIAAGSYTPSGSNGTNFDFALVRYLVTPKSLAKFDFDGDGKTDISIFRPSVGEWWYQRSSDGGNYAAQFGASTDKLTPADFTGDGKTDIALFRPSTGEWFVLRSEDASYYSFPFGTSGDIPFAGDFDADGKADNGVFRRSSATWFIRKSSDGTAIIQQFGQTEDIPVIADYDGDGKSDIAIYRPSLGEWWIYKSTNGSVIAFQFGNGTDKPVQGDFTGDGKADAAVWRPSTGEWFVLRSQNQSYYSFPFGISTDIPAPGDYDGDGKFDAAVFRPSTATWYVQKSTSGYSIQQFGQSGDKPVPNSFVP